MASAAWRSRRGVAQVLVQDAADRRTLTLDDDGAEEVEIADPDLPEEEPASGRPYERKAEANESAVTAEVPAARRSPASSGRPEASGRPSAARP